MSIYLPDARYREAQARKVVDPSLARVSGAVEAIGNPRRRYTNPTIPATYRNRSSDRGGPALLLNTKGPFGATVAQETGDWGPEGVYANEERKDK